MSQQLTLSLIQSNILYMKEIGESLFLITNFTAKVACLCRKQIHFFCVQKAGHGDKKKMVIFMGAVIWNPVTSYDRTTLISDFV